MKNRLFFYASVLLLIGFSILSCEKEEKETKPNFLLEQSGQISDEIYDIYSLVINEKYSSEKIVIDQATKTSIDLNYENQFYDYFFENYQNFDLSLVQIHEDINENSVNFGEQFHSDTKEIILISSDELSYIFDSQDLNADWEEFYNNYENSNGIIRFSRIAFNEDKTQAIFEIGHSYASLGGEEALYILRNRMILGRLSTLFRLGYHNVLATIEYPGPPVDTDGMKLSHHTGIHCVMMSCNIIVLQ